MCSEISDVAEIFQDERDDINVDHVGPEVIVTSYYGDSANMAVGKSTNTSHMKCKHLVSDFSLPNSVLADMLIALLTKGSNFRIFPSV